MHSALNRHTGEIEEAETLESEGEVDHDAYGCHGCGIVVTPASYLPTHKNRAYFRTQKEKTHTDECWFRKIKSWSLGVDELARRNPKLPPL